MDTYASNRKVLYVDDEANLLSSFTSLLRKEKVETTVLQASQQIEEVLKTHGPFAVVFSDQRMPELDGVGVLKTVARFHPNTVRILMTGYADYSDTVRAINTGGISHFVAKPWKDEELRSLVQESINKYNLVELNEFLFKEVQAANSKLEELLDGTVVGTVRILSDILTYVNPTAASQVDRVRKLGNTFLEMVPNLDMQEKWEIQRALDLFNLGLALLPPTLQVAATKGMAVGSQLAKNHHMVAANLLKGIPRFGGVARIIELHAKDFDGGGEPVSVAVKGDEIPFGARLLHILVDLVHQNPGPSNGVEILKAMARNSLKYDASIIQRMLSGQAEEYHSAQEKQLTILALRTGMIVLEDITTLSGQLLLRSNSTLTETSINILLQWYKNEPVKEPVRVKA